MTRFHVDKNMSPKIAPLLTTAGHLSVYASDLGMDRHNDEEHLLAATRNNRAVVTNNAKDFILLHDAWLRWTDAWGIAPQHAGILVIPSNIPVLRVVGRYANSSQGQRET